MALPELVKRSAEKILSRYCGGQVPSRLQEQARLTYQIRGDSATLYEEKPAPGLPGEPERIPIAQFRFNHQLSQWTLHYPGERGKWHIFLNASPSLDLGKLLKFVDDDPMHMFWGG